MAQHRNPWRKPILNRYLLVGGRFGDLNRDLGLPSTSIRYATSMQLLLGPEHSLRSGGFHEIEDI